MHSITSFPTRGSYSLCSSTVRVHDSQSIQEDGCDKGSASFIPWNSEQCSCHSKLVSTLSISLSSVPSWEIISGLEPSTDTTESRYQSIHISSHLSLNREGRWGTTDDFATSFLHFSLFSTALWDLANSRPDYSLMLSSHLIFCLLF